MSDKTHVRNRSSGNFLHLLSSPSPNRSPVQRPSSPPSVLTLPSRQTYIASKDHFLPVPREIYFPPKISAASTPRTAPEVLVYTRRGYVPLHTTSGTRSPSSVASSASDLSLNGSTATFYSENAPSTVATTTVASARVGPASPPVKPFTRKASPPPSRLSLSTEASAPPPLPAKETVVTASLPTHAESPKGLPVKKQPSSPLSSNPLYDKRHSNLTAYLSATKEVQSPSPSPRKDTTKKESEVLPKKRSVFSPKRLSRAFENPVRIFSNSSVEDDLTRLYSSYRHRESPGVLEEKRHSRPAIPHSPGQNFNRLVSYEVGDDRDAKLSTSPLAVSNRSNIIPANSKNALTPDRLQSGVSSNR